jgi:sigma-B regulation protein RsbU (phosphoserine phosphatase)
MKTVFKPGLQGVLDAMDDKVRVLNTDFRVMYANKGYTERFGDQVGTICRGAHGLGRCENCISAQTMTTGTMRKKQETINGRTYQITSAPARSASGDIVGSVEVFRDITNEQTARRRLERQNRQLMSDAVLAARTQQMLLSHNIPKMEGIDIHARSLPKSGVGGDMYGALDVGGGKTLFFIADVAGHGVTAAMISVMLVQLMRNIAVRGVDSSAQVLSRIVAEFMAMGMDDSVYATMFVGLIDRTSGEVVYSNGGHAAAPLLFDGNAVTSIFMPGKPISNWVNNSDYREQKMVLPQGGRLLLFTDGLMNKHYAIINEDKVVKLLTEKNGEELIDSLVALLPEKSQ